MNQQKIKKYANFIFSFFKGDKVGQGLFFNTLSFCAEKSAPKTVLRVEIHEIESTKKKSKIWTFLGGTGLVTILGVISFFPEITGYTIKDFIEKTRAEEKVLSQPLRGDKMEQPFPSENNKSLKNDYATKTENNTPEKVEKLIVRERDTKLDSKEDINPITTLIKIEGIGECNTQMDSITAWSRAKEIAIRDLFMQSKDSISYRVDYEQSFSRHRLPPNDGIYDAKVVVFGYIKKFGK